MTARQQSILTILLFGIISVSLLALLDVPIFFDEAAFSRAYGRAFIDGFTQLNFFPQCASSIESAWMLRPAHLLFSWIDGQLYWAGLRYLPFAACLLFIGSALLMVPRNRSGHVCMAVLCSGFVGVGGVGLMLSRPEFVQSLYLAACAGTWWLARRPNPKGLTVALVMLAHLAIAMIAMFAHPQALLILPLSFVVSMHLLRRWPWAGACVAVIMVLLASQCLQQFEYACPGDPELEAIMKETHGVVFSRSLDGLSWPMQVAQRLKHHVELFFFYKTPLYSVPVPGVPTFVSIALNPFIAVVVALNLAGLIAATAWGMRELWRRYQPLIRARSMRRLLKALAEDGLAVWVLAALLLLFYSVYDKGGMFYRADWRNLLSAWLLAVGVAHYPPSRWIRRWCVLVVIVSFMSAMVLWAWVRPDLRSGFESSYVSLQRDWSSFDARVRTLATRCGIAEGASNVVTDIATYRALRAHPYPIDYNYVWYHHFLKHNAMPQRSEAEWLAYYKKFSASGYVVQCRSLASAPMPVQHRDGDLCCHGFSR